MDFNENSKFYSDLLKAKANAYATGWSFLPFVKEVYLCNSVTIGNARKNSDIDLLIVTQRHSMFLARLVWMFYFWIALQRPLFGFKPNQVCPSVWLDGDLELIETFALDYDPYLDLWKDSLCLLLKKPSKKTSIIVRLLNKLIGSLMLFKIKKSKPDHHCIIANWKVLKFHHKDVRLRFKNCFWEDNR